MRAVRLRNPGSGRGIRRGRPPPPPAAVSVAPPVIVPDPAADAAAAAFDLDLSLLLGGAVVMAIAAFHDVIARTAPLSGPLLAMLAGVAIGPVGLDWIHPDVWGEPTDWMEPASLVTMAIGLIAVGLELPRQSVLARPHRVSLATLLGPVMLLMWAASWLCAWLVLGLEGWAAGLVAAAVVPTDPVLAPAVVSGAFAREHLPARLRDTINAESGANDGLAVPLVAFAALGLAGGLGTAGGWGEWFVETVLWEAAGAAVVGAACGWASAKFITRSERARETDESGLMAFSLAVTLAVLGAAGLLGVSGPLAVFAAGLTFAWGLTHARRKKEGDVQNALNEIFLLPVFGLLGAVLPWDEWAAFGWRGPAFVAAVLLFRRPPWLWLLGRLAPRALPDFPAPRDRLFAGWFGPVGVAGLYYAAAYHDELPVLWPAVTLVVTGSVIAYALTAAPLTRMYGAAAAGTPGRRRLRRAKPFAPQD